MMRASAVAAMGERFLTPAMALIAVVAMSSVPSAFFSSRVD